MNIDVLISFDTTGSMYPCLTEVRRDIKDMVHRLSRDLPGIRIGIIAHGDYCDKDDTYLIKKLDFTTDQTAIIDFINITGNTNGGDVDEAYEYVLREAQGMSWEATGVRAMVVIADAYPHPSGYRFPDYAKGLEWRKEAGELAKMGVAIYSVQCLNRGNSHSYTFFKGMADITKGYHLQLAQFATITAVLTAICYKQDGNERVEQYQQELVDAHGKLTSNMRKIFAIILGKEVVDTHESFSRSYSLDGGLDVGDLRPCPPSKFQVIDVDSDSTIKPFVESRGIRYKAGRGFYEFTKTETIQEHKEVVLMDRATGDLFEGNKARVMAGIPLGVKARVRPTVLEQYRVFVQSTSYNRKLIGGTKFLYEVPIEG